MSGTDTPPPHTTSFFPLHLPSLEESRLKTIKMKFNSKSWRRKDRIILLPYVFNPHPLLHSTCPPRMPSPITTGLSKKFFGGWEEGHTILSTETEILTNDNAADAILNRISKRLFSYLTFLETDPYKGVRRDDEWTVGRGRGRMVSIRPKNRATSRG